jgi:hypothetical protein
MTAATITTDRGYEPSATPSVFARVGLHFIRDPRDLPLLYLTVRLTLIFLPAVVFWYWPGRFDSWLTGWLLAPVYIGLNLFFMAPYLLMLHCTSHRPLFKRQYRALNLYIPWCLGPLFGQTPETFFAHHVGMHHAENNLRDDLSSTMTYDRDRFTHFLRYFLRFAFGGYFELAKYFTDRRRPKLMRAMIFGEAAYTVAIVALLFLNWRATLVVFLWPLANCRWSVMATNWAQHAFIDPKAVDVPCGYSLTVINCWYNRRCFNDGYHIGHHVRMTRHWTEMPADFEAHREEYARHDAVVLEGIDFLGVWWLLMLKRYDLLARRYVELGETKRTEAEIIDLLKSRTRPIDVEGLPTAA